MKHVASHACEILPLILRAERIRWILASRPRRKISLPNREEVTGGRGGRGQVARMAHTRNAYRVWMGKAKKRD